MCGIKRLFGMLLSLAVMALLVSPPARAAAGDATILKSEILSGVAVEGLARDGDTLILLMNRATYATWTRADGLSDARGFDALALGAGEDVAALFQGPDGPRALTLVRKTDEYEGTTRVVAARVWKMSLEDGRIRFGESADLDWPEAEDDGSDSLDQQVCWPYADENLLVFSVGQWRSLMAYDLVTGAAREIEIPMTEPDEQIEGLTGYGHGYALAVTGSLSGESVSFYGVDLATGESKRLFTKEKADAVPGGFVYDEGADRLYYVYRGELLRVEGLEAKTLKAVNTIQINSDAVEAALLMPDGSYVCTDRTSVLLRNTDPDARATATLNVSAAYNSYVKAAADDFMAQNPDVDVILTDEMPDVVTAMMNRSEAVDIYTFDVNSSQFAALYDRGYLADLSGSEILSAYVGEMYPAVQAAVTRDGALVAVPVNEDTEAQAYSQETLARLGLTEADVPTTWSGYLQFLARLPALLGDESILAIPNHDADGARRDVLNRLIWDYALYITRAKGTLSFDTPLFRSLLAEFEKVDFSGLTLETDGVVSDDRGYDQLLSVETGVSCTSFEYRAMTYMPLAMDEGESPLVGWALTVSVVNPYSRNYDAAVRYLETVAGEVWQPLVIDLCPGRNDPIENEDYAESIARQEESIENAKALIEQVTDGTADLDPDMTADEEARMLREALTQYEEELESYRENERYELSPEAIAAYRACADSFTVLTYPGIDLTDPAGEFQAQVSMYLDGLNGADAFIKSIEDMARMMLREGM